MNTWLDTKARATLKVLGGVLPYWMNHVIVAFVVGLIFGGPAYGFLFYAGREIRDWEKAGRFDRPGFWAPTRAMAAWHALRIADQAGAV